MRFWPTPLEIPIYLIWGAGMIFSIVTDADNTVWRVLLSMFAVSTLMTMRAYRRCTLRANHDAQQLPSFLARMDPELLRLILTERDFNAEDYEVLGTLDSSVPSMQGATPSEIRRLPSHTVPDDRASHIQCAICLDTCKPGDIIRTTPCFHQFHASCVDKWLEIKATCPVCKVSVLIA